MKNIGWKIFALVLLLVLLAVFFYQNTTTTSDIYILVTKVSIKTWQLILIMFFLGGFFFCLIPVTTKIKKTFSGNKKSVPDSFSEKNDINSNKEEKGEEQINK